LNVLEKVDSPYSNISVDLEKSVIFVNANKLWIKRILAPEKYIDKAIDYFNIKCFIGLNLGGQFTSNSDVVCGYIWTILFKFLKSLTPNSGS